jgi:hypothetical protein
MIPSRSKRAFGRRTIRLWNGCSGIHEPFFRCCWQQRTHDLDSRNWITGSCCFCLIDAFITACSVDQILPSWTVLGLRAPQPLRTWLSLPAPMGRPQAWGPRSPSTDVKPSSAGCASAPDSCTTKKHGLIPPLRLVSRVFRLARACRIPTTGAPEYLVASGSEELGLGGKASLDHFLLSDRRTLLGASDFSKLRLCFSLYERHGAGFER